MFHKARTGVLWEDLPERFGLWKGVHSRYKTWRNCGVWDDVMATLPGAGQPVWVPPLVPSLRVEGRVDPRVLTGADIQEEAVSAGTGVPRLFPCRIFGCPAARGRFSWPRTWWQTTEAVCTGWVRPGWNRSRDRGWFISALIFEQ
ncbi:transposase [Streptomyces niveus]|uniref:transposase n=1 Tax=Streptomyces niveus TaxID=193462 RepID=UPI0035E1825A